MLEQWDIAREMCFRIAWKPYMYSQTLPHLLGGVRTPALVVWGDDDRIVPLSAAEVYAKSLPHATLSDHPGLRPFRRNGKTRRARQARHLIRRRLIGEARHAHDVFHRTADVAPTSQAGRDFGATALMFSNKHFDPIAGSRLYNEYLEEYILAEEMGVDGIMLNEHHNAPFCMQAKTNIFAVDPGRGDQAREDRAPGQSVAAGGKSRSASPKSWR